MGFIYNGMNSSQIIQKIAINKIIKTNNNHNNNNNKNKKIKMIIIIRRKKI